ncbi:hypothetical protein GGI07_002327 [Coemansia sp. Benny D115]|nr:hypothetical protein GGI07_002327 [Coemansia sp. Benny D115]
MAEHQGEVYCRNCHKKMSSTPSGTNTTPMKRAATPEKPPRANVPETPPRRQALGSPAELSPSSVFSSGRRRISIQMPKDQCPRCQQVIYHAEKAVGPGGPWHRACLRCNQCRTSLDSSTLAEHNGEAYCRPCHTKLFGIHGFNIGGSLEQPAASVKPLWMADAAVRRSTMSPVPRALSPAAHVVSPVRRLSPAASAASPPASSAVDSPFGSALTAAATAAVAAHGARPMSSMDTVSRPVSSRSSYMYGSGRAYKPKAFGVPVVPPDLCPRCSKVIYAAELGMAAGRKYHKACIRCVSCNSSIGSLQITEHEGEIYCRQCYAREFGPKGFRQALGSSINDY